MIHLRPSPGRRRWLALAALLAAALAVGGCATNPVTGKRELSLISTEAEIKLGQQHYASAQQAGGGIYAVEQALGDYVAAVGQRLAAVSDRELPYEFVLLNSAAPNAWALPGGKIAVNRGLLAALENEAELAAVLGHEIVHAAAKHGAQSQQRGLISQVLQLGVAIAGRDSEYADQIVGAAAVSLQLIGQQYSRAAETTSDYHGMKYMRAAGYDTRAAVTLQQKFLALSEGRKSDWISGLFASHPPSAARVRRNRETLADFPAGGELGRARYQQQLALLASRQEAYEKAERARDLLATDTAAALVAIDAAIAQVQQEPAFHGIRGQILAAQGRPEQALRAYNAAIARDSPPGYYAHFLGRGLAYQATGQRQLARADLARSHQLLPTAVAAYQLGNIALTLGQRGAAKGFFKSAGAAQGQLGVDARAAFTRLDVADAPAKYVRAQAVLGAGQVLIELKNTSPVALRDVVVRARISIDGEITARQLSHPRLAAHATARIPSGLRYREGAAVAADIAVVRAEVAH